MAHRARLDHDLIYWGVEEVPALAAGDVAVPADCDLKLGAYRWVPETPERTGHFHPLPVAQQKSAPGAPTLEEAFAAFLTGGAEAAPVVAWLAAYNASMEGL